MDYQFREIRKGERDQVLDFAKAQGCTIEAQTLRHHLSLTVKSAGELVAAALCLEDPAAHFVIEIVSPEGFDQALVTELADRCLRKMQSEAIASARINSTSETSTKTIWKQANWLDHIEETPPPVETSADANAVEDAAAQAA